MARKFKIQSMFDSHHVIERNTILFGAAIVLIGSSFVYSQHQYNRAQYIQLMTVDQNGATATFSQTTNTTLTLGKTQLSTDGKTAFIPVTFSSMDNVGLQANNYKVYVGSASGSPMAYRVAGRLLLYGTNGRAVIVLNSNQRISNEPLVMYVLNEKQVTTLQQAQADSTIQQNSGQSGSNQFGNFDVAPFKINPGAIDIQKRSRLSVDPTQLQSVYEEIFGSADIKNIHKQIDSDNQQIQKYTQVATSLVQRLQQQGYQVPDAPAWMNNSWRPFDAVNLKTGKLANGKSVNTIINNNGADTVEDKDLAAAKLPNSLKNNDGKSTNNTASSSSASGASQNFASTSDPSTQWSNLQAAWTQIESLKRDIYVTQYAQIYQIRQQENSILSQATISDAKKFKQISAVKE